MLREGFDRTLRFRCVKDIEHDGIRFVIGNEECYLKNIELEKREPGTYPVADAFVMGIQQAELLMNDLWDCGIRPHTGEGGAAHVDAMKDHIASLKEQILEQIVLIGVFTQRYTIKSDGTLELCKSGPA